MGRTYTNLEITMARMHFEYLDLMYTYDKLQYLEWMAAQAGGYDEDQNDDMEAEICRNKISHYMKKNHLSKFDVERLYYSFVKEGKSKYHVYW